MAKWLFNEMPIDPGWYIGAFRDSDTGICYCCPVRYDGKTFQNLANVGFPYAWTHLPNAPKHPDWSK